MPYASRTAICPPQSGRNLTLNDRTPGPLDQDLQIGFDCPRKHDAGTSVDTVLPRPEVVRAQLGSISMRLCASR